MASNGVNYVAVYATSEHLSKDIPHDTYTKEEPKQICAVGFAYGEVWMLNITALKRVQLGSFKLGHGNGASKGNAKVLIRGDLMARTLLAFVGLKKCQKHTLQAWNVHTGRAVQIDRNPKLRGLADVVYVHEAEAWLLICGRGIGKAHLWALRRNGGTKAGSDGSSHELRYLGSLSPRGNTLSSMRFVSDGTKVVTCTMEDRVQIWTLPHGVVDGSTPQPFNLRSAQATSCAFELDDISRHLGQMETARALIVGLMEEQNASKQLCEIEVEAWIQEETTRETWRRALFPPRLLDPYAYDGDVDPVTKQPHGYGVKLDDFAGGKELLYEGLWKSGEPHGTGRLVDNRSGDVCYIGGWKAGKRHGFGMEAKGANGERYEGWWRKDQRHGLGILDFSKSFSKGDKLIRYVGFFRNGHPHGLGWFTWPPGCKDWFNVPGKAIEHLGSIRCITQFKNGKFFDEMNFHRADHVPITSNEANLLCHSFDRKKFAKHADGRWEGEECWCCMRLASTNKALVCANPSCKMRVHRKCLPKSVRKFTTWENARLVYCEGEKAFEADIDMWFCPMDKCQGLCKAQVQQASNAQLAEMDISESDFEEEIEDEVEASMDTTEASKAGSLSKPPKHKNLPKAAKPNIKTNRKRVFVPFEGNRDKMVRLADLNSIQDFNSIWYFASDGQKKLVLDDVDLEEALEECSKAVSQKLCLYGC